MMLLLTTLLAAAAAFPFEITPQPQLPVPDPTPAEPCGMASRACMAGVDCASGFCNIAPGATTGCCQDTQWPVPGPQPSPPPFHPACPVSVPLCITDSDCGFSGYCNHTNGGDDFFGCCQFGPAPSVAPFPFPDPSVGPGGHGFPSFAPFPSPDFVTPPAPAAEICYGSITVCLMDSDCAPGDSCSHLMSNSDVFGCCHAGMVDPSVGPVAPTFPPFPFPDPFVTVPPPAAEICPAWITVCMTDSDCSPGDSCSHMASNSDVFGCCHAGMVDPSVGPVAQTFPPFPFPGGPVPYVGPVGSVDPIPFPGPAPSPTVGTFVPPAEEQSRCNVELSCLADADCEQLSGRCEFVFGSPMGCCTPDLM